MRPIAWLMGTVLLTSAVNAQEPAVVTGVVRDERGGPIREALVVIDPDSLSLRVRTGADGRYRLTVPAGRYEVRIVRIGFKPQSQTIQVIAPAIELNVVLQSVSIPLDTIMVRATRPGMHGLVVTRGMSLLPHEPRVLRGANLEVLNTPHNTRTGADGRFSMPQLGAGAHAVMVSLEGFVTRMIPVTILPDGGIEITVVLDSLYAEYQRRDEDQVRGISWRTRRAISPAAFVPLDEIDMEAKDLRDGIRYSYSLLSRGEVIRGGCIYLDGQPRTELALQDINPKDVVAIEVYPVGTLDDGDRLPPFPKLTPCENIWVSPATPLSARSNVRTPRRSRGNVKQVIVVWTKGRR
jgi:hypothetical protein